MKSFLILAAALLGLPSGFVDAAAIAKRTEFAPVSDKRAVLEERQTSCSGVANGPTTRQCWTSGFSMTLLAEGDRCD